MNRLPSVLVASVLIFTMITAFVPAQVSEAAGTNRLFMSAFTVGSDIPPLVPSAPSGHGSVTQTQISLVPMGPGNRGFAFGTSNYVGQCHDEAAWPYDCLDVASFPPTVNVMNNNGVSGNIPMSLIGTTMKLPKAASLTVTIWADDGMEVWYRTGGMPWTAVFGGDAWQSQGATEYDTTVSLSAGTYHVIIGYFNSGGPGLETFYIQGLPAGTSFASYPIPGL